MTTIYDEAAKALSDAIDQHVTEMLTPGEEFTITLRTPVGETFTPPPGTEITRWIEEF